MWEWSHYASIEGHAVQELSMITLTREEQSEFDALKMRGAPQDMPLIDRIEAVLGGRSINRDEFETIQVKLIDYGSLLLAARLKAAS
jgi:hypothetical protein